MALGDIYKVTLFQEYVGQVMLNVFWYQVTSGSSNNANSLLIGFMGNVATGIAGVQVSDVTYTRVLVQNVTNITDNAEDLTPSPSGGTILTEETPLRLAMGFRSNRPDLSARYSYKRIGGVALEFLVGSQWDTSNAAITTLEADLATFLGLSGVTYTPVQVHITYPGGGAPATYDVNYQISEFEVIPHPTTQNSRAFGRGI